MCRSGSCSFWLRISGFGVPATGSHKLHNDAMRMPRLDILRDVFLPSFAVTVQATIFSATLVLDLVKTSYMRHNSWLSPLRFQNPRLQIHQVEAIPTFPGALLIRHRARNRCRNHGSSSPLHVECVTKLLGTCRIITCIKQFVFVFTVMLLGFWIQ